MGIKTVKLPDGKTRYVITASRRDKYGKRYQRKRYAWNLPRAKGLERELYKELDNALAGKPNLKWKEFIDIYYAETELDSRRISTKENEKLALQKHVYPRWKEKFLSDITKSDVQHLIKEAVGNRKPQTQKTLAGFIRNVFRMAIERGYVSKNPAEGVSFRIERRQKLLPSYDQIREFLTKAKERQVEWYPLWHFLALSGMRSGEAHALKWRSVALENKIIMVTESWSRRGGEREATKNGEWRTIPINAELHQLLLELREKTYQGNESYVLPRLREWTSGEAAKSLRLFLKGLNIPPLKLHDLRSVFITQMLRAGCDIPTIMRLVSHKRLETTAIYVSLAGVDIAKATDRISFLEKPTSN